MKRAKEIVPAMITRLIFTFYLHRNMGKIYAEKVPAQYTSRKGECGKSETGEDDSLDEDEY